MRRPQFDQRGEGYGRVQGGRIDMGAFETPPPGPALPGDYNLDHSVDAADYVVWRKTLGQSGLTPYSGADGDGDGTIDADDYVFWRANFGATISPPGSGSGTNALNIAESVIEVSEAIESVPAEITAKPIKMKSFAGRAAGFALFEVGSLRSELASPRERLSIRNVSESARDNLLLVLASDRIGHSSRHDFSVVEYFGSEDAQADDPENQDLVNEPLAAALAEWR